MVRLWDRTRLWYAPLVVHFGIGRAFGGDAPLVGMRLWWMRLWWAPLVGAFGAAPLVCKDGVRL